MIAVNPVENQDMSKNSHDPLYRLALETIIKNDRCSISLMQRNLHVDYFHA